MSKKVIKKVWTIETDNGRCPYRKEDDDGEIRCYYKNHQPWLCKKSNCPFRKDRVLMLTNICVQCLGKLYKGEQVELVRYRDRFLSLYNPISFFKCIHLVKEGEKNE